MLLKFTYKKMTNVPTTSCKHSQDGRNETEKTHTIKAVADQKSSSEKIYMMLR